MTQPSTTHLPADPGHSEPDVEGRQPIRTEGGVA